MFSGTRNILPEHVKLLSENFTLPEHYFSSRSTCRLPEHVFLPEQLFLPEYFSFRRRIFVVSESCVLSEHFVSPGASCALGGTNVPGAHFMHRRIRLSRSISCSPAASPSPGCLCSLAISSVLSQPSLFTAALHLYKAPVSLQLPSNPLHPLRPSNSALLASLALASGPVFNPPSLLHTSKHSILSPSPPRNLLLPHSPSQSGLLPYSLQSVGFLQPTQATCSPITCV